MKGRAELYPGTQLTLYCSSEMWCELRASIWNERNRHTMHSDSLLNINLGQPLWRVCCHYWNKVHRLGQPIDNDPNDIKFHQHPLQPNYEVHNDALPLSLWYNYLIKQATWPLVLIFNLLEILTSFHIRNYVLLHSPPPVMLPQVTIHIIVPGTYPSNPKPYPNAPISSNT